MNSEIEGLVLNDKRRWVCSVGVVTDSNMCESWRRCGGRRVGSWWIVERRRDEERGEKMNETEGYVLNQGVVVLIVVSGDLVDDRS